MGSSEISIVSAQLSVVVSALCVGVGVSAGSGSGAGIDVGVGVVPVFLVFF
jgi:hypothetical protein